MKLLIIGKKNCYFSKEAKRTAKKLVSHRRIDGYTYYNIHSKSAREKLRHLQHRVPATHSTFPIVFINDLKRTRYQFLGGSDSLKRWASV